MKSSEHSYRVDEVGESVQRPRFRRLRGYAFDPSLSLSLETAMVNEVVFKVRWEDAPATPADPSPIEFPPIPDLDVLRVNGPTPEGRLLRGPVGEYLEVIDFDPASGCFYEPVDLNAALLLAQDGLEPSEGNPKFHQQMVYAVAMTTIEHFERALGRPAMWAPVALDSNGMLLDGPAELGTRSFVQRLRVYPHAIRDANAFYSPQKQALLFGYFPAPQRKTNSPTTDGHFPGGWVFTCLSHDIIAHETTHALLHGMHPHYTEPTHPDTLAFHEAFSDLVALFQHFTFREVLQNQIARTRGDLSSQSLLGELAQQFGQAIGQHGALRSAIGEWVIDKDSRRTWQALEPDPEVIRRTLDPHGRGAILVAAVFDAFLAVYSTRIADLVRIATSGTGVLPEGELHPDLVNRLGSEAAKTAEQVLRICIRALDYCPPVDLTFGDYLRAIITADSDLVPSDEWNFRVAFIEAFRRRGIYPRNVRTMSVDSLRWPTVALGQGVDQIRSLSDALREVLHPLRDHTDTRRHYFDAINRTAQSLEHDLSDHLRNLRNPIEDSIGHAIRLTASPGDPALQRAHGFQYNADGTPVFRIEDVRLADRVGPDGTRVNHAIVILTQTRTVELDPDVPGETFEFRGGVTLIFDLNTYELRYAITKSVTDDDRLEAQRALRRSGGAAFGMRSAYRVEPFGDEPFALLHLGAADDLPDGMDSNE